MSHNDPDAHRAVIRIWQSAGAKEPPMQAEAQAVILLLRGQYPDFTLSQLERAIELARSRTLDGYGKEENLKTYGSPNVDYIGFVMAAFSKYVKDEMGRLRSVSDAASRRTAKERMSPAEAWDIMISIASKHGEVPLVGPWTQAYRHAVDSGLLKLTDAQREEIRDAVRMRKMSGRIKGSLSILTRPYVPTFRDPEEEAALISKYKADMDLAKEEYERLKSSIPDEEIADDCKREALERWFKENIEDIKKGVIR